MDPVEDGNALENTGIVPHELQRAIASFCLSEITALLHRGADPNGHGEYYGDPLSASAFCCSEYPGVISDLLAKGAFPDSPGELHGPPLNAAAEVGNVIGARILLSAGADTNGRGGRWVTALQAAIAMKGDDAQELVELLLDRGADVTITDGEFHPPLSATLRYCSVDGAVLSLILERTLQMRQNRELLNKRSCSGWKFLLNPKNPDCSAETLPPIQGPWARLTETLEPNPTQSQPTDELETEIRDAPAQLANLIRQRRLIELQQYVSDEQAALEVARKRLAATSSKDRSPTVMNDSVNRQDRVLITSMQNAYSKAGIIQAPNTADCPSLIPYAPA